MTSASHGQKSVLSSPWDEPHLNLPFSNFKRCESHSEDEHDL